MPLVTFCFSPFLYLPFAPCFKGPVSIRRLSYTHRPLLFIHFIFPLDFLFRALRCIYMCTYLCMLSLVSPVLVPQFIISRGLLSYYLTSTPACTYVAALHSAPMHILWVSCSGFPDSTPPLIPLCGVRSWTPLILHYWTGRRDTEFPPAGSRLFVPFTLNLTEVFTFGNSATRSTTEVPVAYVDVRPPSSIRGGRLCHPLSHPACAPSHAQFPPLFPSCPSSFSPFLLFFFRGGLEMRLLCFSRGGHQFFGPWNCL
jgi:hypothetical protein